MWNADHLPLAKVALEEWSNGKLKLFHNLIEISEFMESEIRGAKVVIANFKGKQPKVWWSFCQRVHRSNIDGYNTSLVLSMLLNHIAVGWEDFKDIEQR